VSKTTKPQAPSVEFATIPHDMKRARRWVVWRYEQRPDLTTGELKWTKVPYQAGSPTYKASSTNPKSWGTFFQAQAAYAHGDADGVGFVLGDGWAGVDLDHCVDAATDTLYKWALDPIRALDSYAELSPSGGGVHILLRGKIADADGRKSGGIEVYSARRFLTVTGAHLPETPTTVEARQDALDEFCRKHFPAESKKRSDRQRERAQSEPLPLDDEALIAKACAANDGGKFRALWQGDTSGYKSHSEAVAALLVKLAFWTREDAPRMDRLFRRSDLMCEKWEEKRGESTWGDCEIDSAIDFNSEVYDPAHDQQDSQGGQDEPDDQDEDDSGNAGDKAEDPPENETAILAGLVERAKADRGAAFVPKVLEALVKLQWSDTPAWVRLREELGKAGVPMRELDRAMGRARFRVFRGGRDADANGGAKDDTGSEPYRTAAGPYRVVNGAICLEKEQRDILGPEATVSVPLCNFAARIAAEEVHDDGAEQTTILVIEGKLQYGEQLPHARIPADRYAGMGWVTANWGARAVVYAGMSMRDHLRAAVQLLSGTPPRSTIYGHTGWRKVDGAGWVYMHAGGGLSATGAEPSVQVDLPDVLSRYVLPEPPEGETLVTAIRASMGMLKVAPDVVTIPLYAGIWRAALGAVDLSIHVHGHTGEGKTAIVTLAQQHYGAGMGARELPANWTSTANSLEALAFQTKDAILVVDDFVPHGSAADVQRFHRDADRLFRGQGNASGRQRMTADGRLRPAKRSRGLIVSTGEEVPHGQSLRARLLILEHVVDTLDWEKLTVCQQDAASGRYAETLAGFLQWLAPQYETVRDGLRGELEVFREKAARGALHKRTPEIVANLALGWRYFLDYAEEKGAITTVERNELAKRVWKALGEVAAAQARYQAESEPTRRFIELLVAAIASGKAHVAAQTGQEPVTPEAWGWRLRTIGTGENARDEWQPQGARIGWFDGVSALYLEPEAAYAAAQAVGQQVGDGLIISAQTLRRRLHQRGLLVSTDPKRETLTIRRILEGKSRDVLHLSPSTLFPSQGPDKPDKLSHKEDEDSAEPEECRVFLSGEKAETTQPAIDPTSASPPESWAGGQNVGFVGFPSGEKGSPGGTPLAEADVAVDGAKKAGIAVGGSQKPDSKTRHFSQNPTMAELGSVNGKGAH
jgi:hypothetical protein